MTGARLRDAKSIKGLSSEASNEAARLVYLRTLLSDIQVALARIPRGPRTARRVGALLKQLSSVEEILRGLAERIISDGCYPTKA